MLLIAVLAGCKGSDAIFGDINNPEAEFDRKGGFVPAEVMMNVSSVHKTDNTRLTDAVTLLDGTSVRRVNAFYLIPYKVQGEIKVTDTPEQELVDEGASFVDHTNYHYYGEKFSIPKGTASFLCYGRAAVPPSPDKAVYGSTLTPNLSNRMPTSDIYFAPDPIYNNNNVAHATATALAAYLTSIANAGNWAANLSTLGTNWSIIFEQFTAEGNLVAGSSANVEALVGNLYRNVAQQTGATDATLRDAILAAIAAPASATVTGTGSTATVKLDASLQGSPANIGLPDGAAVLKWNSTDRKFDVHTEATTLASMVSQNRYAYPAELYFYANSLIATSYTNVDKENYKNKTWVEVLNAYYPNKERATVNNATKSVAIIDPLTYGVGSLRATVQANSATLLDADGQSVTLGAETFPLTGLLVGGQYKQDFNFIPSGDINEYVIYDKNLTTGVYLHNTPPLAAFSTLTYQSKDGSSVALALEFENKSDQIFRGVNGYVYPGTKFYLVGTINPATGTATGTGTIPSEAAGRVFTKRYITQAVLNVSSLEKAYNVVPDLLSARLEVGVKVETEWIESTAAQVILE